MVVKVAKLRKGGSYDLKVRFILIGNYCFLEIQ